jgi:REP element-mobilizing transposase RayT
VPDYLLTFHAYGTWMPARAEGSFHSKRGYQPQSHRLAQRYRAKQQEPSARFSQRAQRVLIEAARETAAAKRITIHAIATDDAHVHIICEWEDDRSPARVQDRMKHALAQRLNENIGRRSWFSRGGKPKAVADVEHF